MSHAEEPAGASAARRIPAPRAREVASRVHGEPAVSEEGTPYEGLVTRALAFAVDAAVINLVAAGVGVVVGLALSIFELPNGLQDALVGLGALAWFVWTIAYFVTFWSSTGQTPGNRLLRIRVCDARDRTPLRPRRSFMRLVYLMLAALPLFAGFLPILVDSRRRGLHDMLARSVVVSAEQEARSPASAGA
jgi:uncharacterized RDD family membrane protein YckC